ncbi:unnamed protein product [Pleuronectes platessa]|uniref:Uncharacterized protein n=1 Tax=Pleuronectes platessa TaxID=8262 RepID=A0A9N7YNA5_PLEPL|nr:unnamed protein product [Pleuronectes platessa]
MVIKVCQCLHKLMIQQVHPQHLNYSKLQAAFRGESGLADKRTEQIALDVRSSIWIGGSGCRVNGSDYGLCPGFYNLLEAQPPLRPYFYDSLCAIPPHGQFSSDSCQPRPPLWSGRVGCDPASPGQTMRRESSDNPERLIL